jgi:acetolactate synthase-1/2/3 large subunit
VNDSESRAALGAQVRQAGFQETDIVSIAKPITKYAVQVHSVSELVTEMRTCIQQAITGRMGPVLIDIPMNVQKEVVPSSLWDAALRPISPVPSLHPLDWDRVSKFLSRAQRPLVVVGGGAALTGTAQHVQRWCEAEGIPYVASWGAMPNVNRGEPLYRGALGVYGSPRANWTVQAADSILALGSRLDNRQRTGNPQAFAPFADVLVVDIDQEELNKFSKESKYSTLQADLASWTDACEPIGMREEWASWRADLASMDLLLKDGTEKSVRPDELNPYEAVRQVQSIMPQSSIVVADCGANLCWVYQSFMPDDSILFTAAGNSPMGYSLPAAIGAKRARPEASVWCFIGDGGLQMNIQELQTIVHYELEIFIVVMNNRGYGIIKQFQDAYFDGRYEATGQGYSVPDFGQIAEAYGIQYVRATSLDDIKDVPTRSGPTIIDIVIAEGALITPKVEMDRFLHDQFPYAHAPELAGLMKRSYPDRPSLL